MILHSHFFRLLLSRHRGDDAVCKGSDRSKRSPNFNRAHNCPLSKNADTVRPLGVRRPAIGLRVTRKAGNMKVMSAPGFKSFESHYSVHETLDRLEELLQSKKIKIFARLDQAAEAKAVGIAMRPMELLIFGDPKTGSPLMIQHPSLAIDLPLKALAWESEEKKVYLSFNSSEYLAERHQMAGQPFRPVEGLLAQAAL
jgi:uncharacterized protein (DUF302 family)